MTPTRKRLEVLEARAGAGNSVALEAEHGRAVSNLFNSLQTALPAIDETYRVPSKLYSHAFVTEGLYISSVDRIIALSERIEAGRVTADDLAVLASLSLTDLNSIGKTAESFVAILLNITRIY